MLKTKITQPFFYTSIIILWGLFSCNSNVIYEKNKHINENNWNKDDIIKFNVEINDTISPYNFYINIRNTVDYSYNNIFFFINTLYPNDKSTRDTIECILADFKGKWSGKGLGDIKDNRFLLKKNIKFPVRGIYSFEFQHGMRVDNLHGIIDVGIRIEKLQNEY